MQITSINGMGWVQARKQFDGYALYYRGTRNEVYPGERFRSAHEARQYHAVHLVQERQAAEMASAGLY